MNKHEVNILCRVFFPAARAYLDRGWTNVAQLWRALVAPKLQGNQLVLDTLSQSWIVTDKGNLKRAAEEALQIRVNARTQKRIWRREHMKHVPVAPDMFSAHELSRSWLDFKTRELDGPVRAVFNRAKYRTNGMTRVTVKCEQNATCEVRRTTREIILTVRPDWLVKVRDKGLSHVDGRLILAADPCGPRDRYELFSVMSVKQLAGYQVAPEVGWVVRATGFLGYDRDLDTLLERVNKHANEVSHA